MHMSKKGRMMRHPYLSIAVLGLAAAGAVSITNKVKDFVKDKAGCITGMMQSVKSVNKK